MHTTRSFRGKNRQNHCTGAFWKRYYLT